MARKKTAEDKGIGCIGSFRTKRAEAIKDFIEGSGAPWRFWKKKWNFRCVKAICSVETWESIDSILMNENGI